MPHPSGRPWIVAHRGASHERPENTLDAFHHAVDLGADAIELDVRRTADGALVVIHDPVIGGVPVVGLTRAELAAIAPGVPDLGDAIDACRGAWVDVEVKNDPAEPDWDPDAAVAAAVAGLLAARPDVILSSFDPASVGVGISAGMRTGLLVDVGIDPIAAMSAVPGIAFLFPPVESVGVGAAGLVREAAALGVEVGVWWTDDPGEIRRLADAGVGAVFTERPDVAARALG